MRHVTPEFCVGEVQTVWLDFTEFIKIRSGLVEGWFNLGKAKLETIKIIITMWGHLLKQTDKQVNLSQKKKKKLQANFERTKKILSRELPLKKKKKKK